MLLEISERDSKFGLVLQCLGSSPSFFNRLVSGVSLID